MPAELLPQPEILPEQAFTEFVFKLSSRCNMQPPEPGEAGRRQLPILANGGVVGCDQCYEYVDTTAWKKQPPIMPLETAERAALRIAEHAEANELEDIRIVCHGGEPLMVGLEYLSSFATTVRKTIEATGSRVHFSIQTNGLLLTQKKLFSLLEHRFAIGLSLDGNQEANDLHRRDRCGRSTYDRVLRAAELLNYFNANWGLLSVIDTVNDPEETLESLAALKPKAIKMHPRLSNWTTPHHPQGISLGEWQVRVFERYRQWGKFHPGQNVAPFLLYPATDYIDTLLGAAPTDERVANRYPHELFFLPNGNVQRLDTLKTTEAGAFQTRFNVFEHSLNEIAATDPGFIARRLGSSSLAQQCQVCPLLDICGGDYYPLRFKQAARPLDESSAPQDFVEAFKNPSVYCADQKRFLGHLAAFVRRQKALAAQIPVDIHEAWQDQQATRQKERNHDYAIGALSDTSSRNYTGSLQFLMGRCDKIAKDGSFEPLDTLAAAFTAKNMQEGLVKLIKNGTYSGKGAIVALEQLAKQQSPDQQLYFQSDLSRRPGSNRFRTIEDLYTDRNHAIIKAMFNPEQFILEGCEFICLRAGQYWVVTKNAVEAHARAAGLPPTAFVSLLLLPSEHANDLLSNRPSVETENFIARLQPYKTPVGVTLSDAPANLLVVDVTGASPQEVIDAAKTVAATIPQYDHPEQVSVQLEQQGSPISLVPITGSWWHLRPKNVKPAVYM